MSRQGTRRGFDASRGGSRRRGGSAKPRKSWSFLTTFAVIVAAGTLALWIIDRPGKPERLGGEAPVAALTQDAG